MISASLIRAPELSLRFMPVWRRNLLVWRKLAIASVLGNIADPLLYMLALGYGIGSFIGEVGGMTYIAFIGTGMVCQSAMFTVELRGRCTRRSRGCTCSARGKASSTRRSRSTTSCSPNGSGPRSKAVMSTTAILVVIMVLGFGHTWLALWVLPLGFLVGLSFGAFGLVMNALAPELRFLHLLLHAGADADAAAVGRLLPGRPDAGVARDRRERCCRSSTRSTSRGR